MARMLESGVRVSLGADGEVHWKVRLTTRGFNGWSGSEQLPHLLSGPDLDGDKVPEIFVALVAQRGEAPPILHLDDPAAAFRYPSLSKKDTVIVYALWGKDGRALWWWPGTAMPGCTCP